MRRRFKEEMVVYERESLEQKRKRLKGQTLFALSTGLICGFITGYLFTLATSLFSTPQLCTLENFHPYNVQVTIPKTPIHEEPNLLIKEHFTFRTDNTVAKKLRDEIRIFCWVMTSSDYHKTRATHVKNTWGRRCDKLIFFSNVHNGELPAVSLTEFEGRHKYWNKTLQAMDYIYANYYFHADWFIKVDDTTYVIMENLRYLLSHYSKEDEYYIGCKYRHESTIQGFMVEKAGYVLSRKALQKVAVVIIPHYAKLLPAEYSDLRADIKLGYLLGRVGVKVIDTRDVNEKERFHPFDPKTHVYEVKTDNTEINEWWDNRYYTDTNQNGVACCSDTAITFSYMSSAQMYVMEYIVYHLRPYGILRY